MISRLLDVLDPDVYGVQVDSKWRCWNCGKGSPVLQRRWCSAGCRRKGEAMLIESPSPQEIDEAARAIRASWSPDEAAQRTLKIANGLKSLFDCLAG